MCLDWQKTAELVGCAGLKNKNVLCFVLIDWCDNADNTLLLLLELVPVQYE